MYDLPLPQTLEHQIVSTLPNIQNVTSPVSVAFGPQDGNTRTVTNRRVLHLINGEHYSGAERVQDLLGMRLPEFGYDVTFACVKPDKFPTMRQGTSANVVETPMKSRFDTTATRRICELVEEQRCSIIHAHTPRTVMLGSSVAKRMGVPLVYHVHSPTSRDSTRRLQNWFNNAVERYSLRNVALMITVSHSLCWHMESLGYGSHQLAVVPNGVPVTEDRRSNKSPGKTWTLGTVALFRQRKGTEVLLDAMAQLREQGHDVKLRAVGPFETPEYEKLLKDQVTKLDLTNHVEWVGFTKDVTAELRQMDLFVLPSLFGEGLPMVVLEAMAAGVPPVGTLVEGVPEAIRHGENGLLAEPSDSEDLAKAIAMAVSGEVNWQELRTNAIKDHAERFSDEAMARGVADAYNEMLGL